MALPTLNLDDRSYAQLLEILRSHIPAEEWSDHNPSDPGIALLELLTWLGEMSLYRMNRIPQAHRDKFLKLIADPPEPVTVELTLTLSPKRTTDVVLLPGMRFATPFQNGTRYVFESYSTAIMRAPPPLSTVEQSAVVRLRAVREVTDELLGVSDGTPNQVFAIAEHPVLVDFASLHPDYDPNPKIAVGADTSWELRPFLKSAYSHTPAPAPAKKHFMVDAYDGCVRFGDGTFGAIPPAGAAIKLVRYRVLEDRRALVVPDQLVHFLDPQKVQGGLGPGETLSFHHSDAQGGDNFYSRVFSHDEAARDEVLRRRLASFRVSTRLVTAADFERMASVDFNAFQRDFNRAQGLALDNDLVGRAVAVMNRKPPLSAVNSSPGHVTVLVLPSFDEAAFNAASVPAKIAMATLSPGLRDRIAAFLEPRRLITTRLHVAAVDVKVVTIDVVAVVDRQRNSLEMQQAIEAALQEHLSLVRGFDGRGWPLARAVRRSQIYALLEGLPGVDHIESLMLAPGNPAGDVELMAQELPIWGGLNVQVKRA